MQINKYATEAAYAADTERLATKSAISQIAESNSMKYDGVNVIVYDKAAVGIGDLVVFDKDKEQLGYIKADTLVASEMSDNLVPCAVVFARQGDNVYILALTNASYNNSPYIRYAHPFEAMISGIDNSVQGSISITFKDEIQNSEVLEISWNGGDSLSSIAQSINTAVLNLSASTIKAWKATVEETKIIMTHDFYRVSTINAISGTDGGANVSYIQDQIDYNNSFAYLTANAYMRKRNRATSLMIGVNLQRMYLRHSTAGVTPASQIAIDSNTIVNEEAFNSSQYCNLLRMQYIDYNSYLDSHRLQYPSAYYNNIRSGKEITEQLAMIKGTSVRGANEPCFPFAYACQNFAIEGTNLINGVWFAPSVSELYLLISKVSMSTDTVKDVINQTLARINGREVFSNTHYMGTATDATLTYRIFYAPTYGMISNDVKYSVSIYTPIAIL